MCPVAYRSRRQITFSGTVKNPFGRGAHEDRLLSLLRRAGLQEQDGRVPGGLAHARVRQRGPQGRLRRRHIPRQGPRRPHRAVAEVWSQTMVQRCLWHAFSQVNRHMTGKPRLRAGIELRGLAVDLMHVETLRAAGQRRAPSRQIHRLKGPIHSRQARCRTRPPAAEGGPGGLGRSLP